jgi:hypothetical protein
MCPGGFQSYHTQIIEINQPIKIPLPYKSMQKKCSRSNSALDVSNFHRKCKSCNNKFNLFLRPLSAGMDRAKDRFTDLSTYQTGLVCPKRILHQSPLLYPHDPQLHDQDNVTTYQIFGPAIYKGLQLLTPCEG